MSEPEYVFVTVAFEYTSRHRSSAGFFCLWDEELTFVSSKWIRFVTPVTGIVLGRVRPDGPNDPRTRTRVGYADVAEIALYDPRKRWIRLVSRRGAEYFFGGGQLNSGFDFLQVSGAVKDALDAAGYKATRTADRLTVTGSKGQP